LQVALELLHEEGLDAVFDRHKRAAEATRRAVQHWGFEIQCRNPAEYSSSLTAVVLPEGHYADRLRAEILQRCDISLGNGLGPLTNKVFRIGHLGDFNDTTVTATLSGIEMGLRIAGVPHHAGGVNAAMDYLAGDGAPIARAAE